jgi:methyl-accepting chemotaxis protein
MVRKKNPSPIPQWQRQRAFSQRWFQVRITMYYILILLGGITGLSFYLYRYTLREVRFEMFSGHSTAVSPWEILRGGILAANGVATLAVILVAAITTLVITRSVSRAASRLAGNLLSTLDGGVPHDWNPPSGIHEFQHLHRLLAEAIDNHHERVAELKELSLVLGEMVRTSRLQIEQQGLESNSLLLKDMHLQCNKLKGFFHTFKMDKECRPSRPLIDSRGRNGETLMEKPLKNVSARFEYTWILWFALMSLFGSAVLLLVLKSVFSPALTEDYGKAFVILKNMQGLLIPHIALSAFLYAAIVSVLAAAIIFYLSHSIVVPLFRIEKGARHIRKGDLSSPIRFKQGDQLEELLVAAERLRKKYEGQLRPVRTSLDAIDGAWKTIDKSLAEPDEDAVNKTLAATEEHLAMIARTLEA